MGEETCGVLTGLEDFEPQVPRQTNHTTYVTHHERNGHQDIAARVAIVRRV